ncbi:MAG: hypothetical protein ACRD20_13330 [Terriglobales bacterium]
MDEEKVKALIAEHCEPLILQLAQAAAGDLASHKDAIDKLNANLVAEHRKMAELADMVNSHEKLLAEYRKVWTENFTNLGELVSQQSRMLEVMRSMILPGAVN